jgi:TPR repeat protein
MTTKKKKSHLRMAVNPAKRQKLAEFCDTVVHSLMCPITLTLPAEPVIAVDGYVYDRRAIQKWFETSDRSPMTNAPITNRLIPAHVSRSMIGLVRDFGLASSEMMASVVQWEKERSKIRRLEIRAREGDARAMFHFAFAHQNARSGLQRDLTTAREWFRKSAQCGYPQAIAVYGSYLLEGKGGPIDSEYGVALVSRVADESDLAAYELANVYWHGLHGVEHDLFKARDLLRRSISAEIKYRNLADHVRERAAADLKQFDDFMTS